MNFLYLKSVSSTQLYLIDLVKKKNLTNLCIYTYNQTDGIGSRGNSWVGKSGNLFFSFVVDKDEFSFVPIQSLSIYFGYLFKNTLNELGSNVVLKWPNDLYLDKKVAGVITNIVKDKIVCGIGVNSKYEVNENFSKLDIDIKNDKILHYFFDKVLFKPNWDEVIKSYKKEFYLLKDRFNIKGDLNMDGSLTYNNERIYSKR